MSTRLSVMITAYAQKKDLSYTDICKEIGIGKSTLSRYGENNYD